MKRQTVGVLLGLFFTVGAVIFAATVYEAMLQVERNLAYMALYYDDLAVDLYRTGGSYDAIVMIQGQAMKYCKLYRAERRTLEPFRYAPVCDVVEERALLFIMCLEDVDLCTDAQLSALENKISIAEDLGKELHELRPYLSLIFSDDPYIRERCYVGDQEAPCPWTQ